MIMQVDRLIRRDTGKGDLQFIERPGTRGHFDHKPAFRPGKLSRPNRRDQPGADQAGFSTATGSYHCQEAGMGPVF